MKYITLILLFYTLNCSATIYMQKNSDGDITYSDTPLENNAKRVVVPEVSTTPVQVSQPITTSTTNSEEVKSNIPTNETARKPYTVFLISSPKDQDTIQNQPVIPVKIKLEPALQKGDKIQLLVDGGFWGNAVASTELSLNQVDRGTHQVYAIMLDKNQRVLKQTTTITIYVHRASVNSPPGRT